MKKSAWQQLFQVLFWVINLPLLLIGYAGVLFTLESYLTDTLAGTLPVDFLFAFAGFIAVPSFCVVLSLRRRSLSVLRLFYGVEAPLLLICFVRFFWLRELTFASGLIVVTGIVCAVAYLDELLNEDSRSRPWQWLQMGACSLLLLVGLYVGVISLFYSIPIVLSSVAFIGFALLIPHLFPFAVIFFVLLSAPIGIAGVYFRGWQQKLSEFATEYGLKKAILSTTAVILMGISIFIGLQHQPQNQAFALLETPPTDSSSRQALVQQSKQIRSGLLNAYLAQYRYPNSQHNNHIRNLYRSLGVSESSAQSLQTVHNFLVAPFLYNGSRTDSDKAALLYAQFFDTPIIKAEQKTIKRAIGATFRRNEAKAGLLDVNEEKVWLARQQITVKEHGDWADVELYEVYDNQTFQQEEILYFFSLPESAVLTGVWLGESANKNQRFPYTVSPRGAAQQVYNDEVTRRVDPALLEQVGPRNYRLRAFPILPKGRGQMHLWLTYKVMQQEGSWALPQLQERRNIFWTKETQRVWNGEAVSSKDEWLSKTIPAKQIQPQAHEVNLAGYQVTTQPAVHSDSLPSLRLAIAVDTSYSMRDRSREVKQVLQWLQRNSLAKNADIYLTTSEGVQPQRLDDLRRFDPRQLTYYGLIQYKEMLRQFAQLRGDTAYDGVLLITDEGSYELSNDSTDIPQMPAPLWMVHLGKLPRAYDDATLQAIQVSGGGATTNVQEAVQRLAVQNSSVVSAEGYTWRIEATQEPMTEDDFAPLAARQLTNSMIQGNQNPNLDAVHAIAKQYDIVTPYSSMIVLVNDRQREALKRAEADEDRFEREIEDRQLPPVTSESFQSISAVPEPAEWMLLSIVAVVLFLVSLRQSRQLAS